MKFTSPATGRRRRAWILAAVIPAAALAALAGCSSSSGSTSAPAAGTSASGTAAGQPTGSQLTIADVAPFSGPDAALGRGHQCRRGSRRAPAHL
jgi:hypothetical protein